MRCNHTSTTMQASGTVEVCDTCSEIVWEDL